LAAAAHQLRGGRFRSMSSLAMSSLAMYQSFHVRVRDHPKTFTDRVASTGPASAQ
jgi:hypothetical protein